MFQRILSNDKDNSAFSHGFYTVMDHRVERMRPDKFTIYTEDFRFILSPSPIGSISAASSIGSGFPPREHGLIS